MPAIPTLNKPPRIDSKTAKELLLEVAKWDSDPTFDSEVAAWLGADGIHIYIYAHPNEETWMNQVFGKLNTVKFAPLIAGMEIKGPDIGEKGTRLYDLSNLLCDDTVVFSRMEEFEVEQTAKHHRNVSLQSYDDYYNDSGAGGRILDKMPQLKSLTLPAAPSPSFFERKHHPLEHLSLQAGYEHEGFIGHLAKAECFPALRHFEWMDGPGRPRFTSCVPPQHIRQLKHSFYFDFLTFKVNGFPHSWIDTRGEP